MKQYAYILLDWDGNLAKTLDVWLEACKVPLAKRGVTPSDEEIALSFGVFTERFAEWGIQDIDTTIWEIDAIAKKNLPAVELYPDALEVLEGLRERGKKTALITTSLRENIEHILTKFNMVHYFDVLIAHEDTKKHKPDPEPLEKALELLGGDKTAAVMIGDSDKDLAAAQNTGIDSILFFPPEHAKFYDISKLKAHQPTHIVSDFREVLNIVGASTSRQ